MKLKDIDKDIRKTKEKGNKLEKELLKLHKEIIRLT